MQLVSYGKTLDKAQRYEKAERKREREREQKMKSSGRELYVFAEKRQDRPKGKICTGGDERKGWRSQKQLEEKRVGKDEASKDESSSEFNVRHYYYYKKRMVCKWK